MSNQTSGKCPAAVPGEMLEKLTLRNFRGFSQHEIPFRAFTVIVGQNNAGKSTIVEALRFVALVLSRYRGLSFHPGPDWTGEGRVLYGVRPSLKNMEVVSKSLFHAYADPPAVITALFSSGQTLTVYVADGERIHGVFRDADGKLIRTRERIIEAGFPSVGIMPQVAPVAKREVILKEDYVRGAMTSPLAHLHFRNQLALMPELFSEFCRLVADTWPGVMIKELIGGDRLAGEQLYLEVRNEDFVGEVSLMGHGLQMWLQTMWFLTRVRDSHTVILDEPDVYMHPDLQRRVVRFLRNRHPQCIITTHSTEVLSEVEVEHVLVVDRRRPRSAFAPTIPAVQRLIDNMGSAHNIQITRLWRARRFLMVEGKDIALLKAFQNTLFPQSHQPIDALPSMQIGGWGGWSYAVGSSMLLKNAMGEAITPYCVLDSDYHTPDEIEERLRQAAEKGVQLHVWSVKEIENFLLIPRCIQRAIARTPRRGSTPPSEKEVRSELSRVVTRLKDDIVDGLATEIQARERRLTPATANKRARERVSAVEREDGNLLRLAPGKTVISELAGWSQRRYNVQLSAVKLARTATRDEIADEVIAFISAVEAARPLDEV